MKCTLHLQFEQLAYLMEIKGKPDQAEKIRNEITRHVAKCETCRETPLVDELFGAPVIVRESS